MSDFRLLVTSSRTWTDPGPIHARLDRALAELPAGDRLVVVTGAHWEGGDLIAHRWATDQRHLGNPVEPDPHPAAWRRYGRRAGPIRNTVMVTLGARECLAFCRDWSSGTTDCARKADASGIPTFVSGPLGRKRRSAMADGTHISWTDATWSPVTGCTRVSDGCTHCYIERTPPLRMAGRKFDKPGIGGTTGVMLHPERLGVPLAWRKSRRIFVCSMADLFHDAVPDEFIAEVFIVMAMAGRHTFQVLTKRPVRMRSLLSSERFASAVLESARIREGARGDRIVYRVWPLPNVWVGTSVESQQWADIRIPALLETPAALRWLSCEPLLAPVEPGIGDPHRGHASDDVLGYPHPRICLTCSTDEDEVEYFRREPDSCGISWVVTGGESGPRARPAHPGWFRSLRDECRDAGVAFHHKQNGEYVSPHEIDIAGMDDVEWSQSGVTMWPDGRIVAGPAGTSIDGSEMLWRVGKKRAGRLLDGRLWDEYPSAVLDAA